MKNKLKNFTIDFNKTFSPVLMIYAALICIGILLAVIFGVNLDINFKGGAMISYSYTGNINEDAVKKCVATNLDKNASVTFNSGFSDSSKQIVITTAGNNALSSKAQQALTTVLQNQFKAHKIEFSGSNSVSPTLAGTFFGRSLVAVALAGIFVVIYVGIRFRNIGGISAALTAFASLILDCIIAFLACVSFRLPVDSNLIAVMLTLLGYSLNDTIVIYDRVRENKRLYPAKKIDELVNDSINTVKTRNFVTTFTTALAVITIIVVAEVCGLTTLRSFAIPMAFGIISGCISSLFVSGPLWVKWINFSAAHQKPDKKRKAKK